MQMMEEMVPSILHKLNNQNFSATIKWLILIGSNYLERAT
jgi:hypothetical protein